MARRVIRSRYGWLFVFIGLFWSITYTVGSAREIQVSSLLGDDLLCWWIGRMVLFGFNIFLWIGLFILKDNEEALRSGELTRGFWGELLHFYKIYVMLMMVLFIIMIFLSPLARPDSICGFG